MIRTGKEEVLADLLTDPGPLAAITRGRPGITPTVDLLKPRALVYMPLRARDRVLGVLALIRTSENFDASDVDTVRELAARAAVAVDNAHLYREAEERAQAARVLASVGDGVFFVDRERLRAHLEPRRGDRHGPAGRRRPRPAGGRGDPRLGEHRSARPGRGRRCRLAAAAGVAAARPRHARAVALARTASRCPTGSSTPSAT